MKQEDTGVRAACNQVKKVIFATTIKKQTNNMTKVRAWGSKLWKESMEAVRIESFIQNFNGSQFGMPPSSTNKMTELGGKMV